MAFYLVIGFISMGIQICPFYVLPTDLGMIDYARVEEVAVLDCKKLTSCSINI